MNLNFTQEQKRYLFLSALMIGAGIFFYAFYREILIINLPLTKQYNAAEYRTAQQKKIRLFYRNGEQFIEGEKELIESANPQDILTSLVARWLTFLEEEEVLPKKVTVQSVLIGNQKQTAYISFDRSPFTKDQSTFEKIVFLEGLFKSLKTNSTLIKKVRILVNHKPLQDPHIDGEHDLTVLGYLP